MASDFFGIPYDLLTFIVIVFAALIIFVTRRVVSGVPVEVNWVYPGTRTALRFFGSMDLNGVFLDVRKRARGKKLATIQRDGLPLEIEVISRKDMRKGYLFEREVEVKQTDGSMQKVKKAFFGLDISAGGRQRITSFISVEGSGKTIDVLSDGKADGKADGEDTPTTSIINEELGTLQKVFNLLGAAMQGSLRGLVLPILTGVGLGMAATLLMIFFTGHFH
jgi:hypothetical protein